MKNRQTGFTMIELIVVIIILGILAATAMPRFMDASGDARASKAQAALGAIRSAMSITHGQQLIDNGGLSAGVTLDGEAITMCGGYPTADANGILIAAGINQGGAVDYTPSPGGAGSAATITLDVPGATTAANCRVTFTAATSVGCTAAIAASASTNIDVTDC